MMFQELGDETKRIESRIIAAILLKNALNSNNEKTQEVWLKYNVETKKTIKKMLMDTLNSDNKELRNGAANVISVIASLEIPRREWPEIIVLLSANALGQNINVKLASLDILGYICEEIYINHLKILDIDLILSVLTHNLKSTLKNDDIKLSAIRTLLQLLPFCHNNFKTENERNSLISHIIAECQNKSSEVRLKAMQCLVKITNEFYDYIQPHLDQLCVASLNAIENDEKEIILQGIELWISICKIELERKKFSETEKPVRGYIDQCYPWLVKVIQENITRIEENDNSDCVSVVCGICISLISSCVGHS